jgi:hypothetical protein
VFNRALDKLDDDEEIAFVTLGGVVGIRLAAEPPL